jgi:hypothetical protein
MKRLIIVAMMLAISSSFAMAANKNYPPKRIATSILLRPVAFAAN